MYGSIIGDMIGSPYEFVGIKTTDFEFKLSCFTDDSVMTVAVAQALMNCGTDYNPMLIKERIIQSMQYFGKKFDHAGYGSTFYSWLFKRNPEPYNSYANGSAMRCGSIAYFYPDDLERALEVAKLSAEVSHNHPEGIKGAVSVTEIIWLANARKDKEELREAASKYYELRKTCDEIRVEHKFDVSCQGTVPVAIQCFLEGNNYEEVVRLAISMGGDSDTLACIAGSMAEAFYGVPEYLKKKCRESLIEQGGEELLEVMDSWEQYLRELERGSVKKTASFKENIRRKAHTMEIRSLKDFMELESETESYHIRLWDEKRQRIFPKDFITFCLADTEKQCIKKVKTITVLDFNELLEGTMVFDLKKSLKQINNYTLDELNNNPVVIISFY